MSEARKSQTIIRIRKHERDYVVMDKRPLNNPKLSWKAKGLLSYLLSKPPDWTIYLSDLKKRAKDGRDSTSSGMKELTKEGHLVKNKLRDKKGRFNGWEIIVYEIPRNTKKPKSGNPNTGNPNTGNPPLLKNNKKLSKYINKGFSKEKEKFITEMISKGKKPYYYNDQIVFKEKEKKWYVIESDGTWLEFAGDIIADATWK